MNLLSPVLPPHHHKTLVILTLDAVEGGRTTVFCSRRPKLMTTGSPTNKLEASINHPTITVENPP